jgi:hypothetical protein
MNRADGTDADTTAASTDQSNEDTGAYRDSSATTWDPYEVWLTRIKQPRERAVRVAALSAPGNAVSARDLVPAR